MAPETKRRGDPILKALAKNLPRLTTKDPPLKRLIKGDGTILDAPGWDETTELLYEPNALFPPIPAEPTREDAKDAAEQLLELVCDFPFTNECHRAAWLAASRAWV